MTSCKTLTVLNTFLFIYFQSNLRRHKSITHRVYFSIVNFHHTLFKTIGVQIEEAWLTEEKISQIVFMALNDIDISLLTFRLGKGGYSAGDTVLFTMNLYRFWNLSRKTLKLTPIWFMMNIGCYKPGKPSKISFHWPQKLSQPDHWKI